MANIFQKIWGSTPTKEVKNIIQAPANEGRNLNKKISSYSNSSRTKQDIQKWRDAIIEAESAYKFRVKMQGIYRDTILNGHVQACISKRKNLTLLREFAIVDKKGRIDEKATAQINAKWFKEIISYIIDAQLFGYSLVNWTGVENGQLTNVQIVNREYVNPDSNTLGSFPYSTNGIDINSKELANWSLWCKTSSDNGISNCGMGLLYPVAAYEIFLRNLMGYNNDFLERFGQPIITATTPKIQEDELGELEQKIAAIGSSGYIIKDIVDTIEYLEYNSVGDSYQLYENMEKRCEQKISKILLGHADALDSTPGKLGSSQGEMSPAQIALMEIQAVDSNYVEYLINDFLIKKLQALEFYFPLNGKFIFLNNGEKEIKKEKEIKNLTDISIFLKNMTDAGYSVDEKWIEDMTGVKVTPIATPPAI